MGVSGSYKHLSLLWYLITTVKRFMLQTLATTYLLGNWVYDNDFRLIIDMNFYETFSTLTSENKYLHFTL
jgi:hypothetical protein